MDKRYRIKKSYEIEAVIKKRNYASTDNFIAYKKENNEANFRYAISVGKKLGDAVIRNKIKRQMRSIIDKLFIPSLKIDVFIIAKKSVGNLKFLEIENELKKIFKKLKVEIKGEEN